MLLLLHSRMALTGNLPFSASAEICLLSKSTSQITSCASPASVHSFFVKGFCRQLWEVASCLELSPMRFFSCQYYLRRYVIPLEDWNICKMAIRCTYLLLLWADDLTRDDCIYTSFTSLRSSVHIKWKPSLTACVSIRQNCYSIVTEDQKRALRGTRWGRTMPLANKSKLEALHAVRLVGGPMMITKGNPTNLESLRPQMKSMIYNEE